MKSEYNRYMKIIGEQESPISSTSFTLSEVDVSFDMPDQSFQTIQEYGLTESQLEEVVMTTCRHLWKEEYIRINKYQINEMVKINNTYTIKGIASVCGGIISDEHIKLTVENVYDISSKPKIIKEVYIPTKKNTWESFSKFFEEQEGKLS